MSEGDGARDLDDVLTVIEEIDADVEVLRSGLRRGSRIWLAVTVTTMAAALPGGILYALYWGVPYTVAGGALWLSVRRKLRALENRRDEVLAIDDRQEAEVLQPPTEQS